MDELEKPRDERRSAEQLLSEFHLERADHYDEDDYYELALLLRSLEPKTITLEGFKCIPWDPR